MNWQFLIDNKEIVLYLLGFAGTIYTVTNKNVHNFIRKNIIKRKEQISLEEAELKLTTNQLSALEQYLKLQDEKFIKLLEENKALMEEQEKINQAAKAEIASSKKELEDYKKYMSKVHKYVLGLQKLLTENKISFEKYDSKGVF